MPPLHPSSFRLHPSRGFSLLELLTVLLILPVFLLLATKLFHTTFRTTQSTQQLLSAESTFDAAAHTLRSDVWSARSITTHNDTTTLTPTAGPPIAWTQHDGALTRQTPTDTRHYAVPPPRRLSLSTDGPDVVLHLHAPPHNNEDIRLTPILPRNPS